MLKDLLMKENIRKFYTLKNLIYVLIALISIFTFFKVFNIQATSSFSAQYNNGILVNASVIDEVVTFKYDVYTSNESEKLFGTVDSYSVSFLSSDLKGLFIPVLSYLLLLISSILLISRFFIKDKNIQKYFLFISSCLLIIGGILMFFIPSIYGRSITNLFTSLTNTETKDIKIEVYHQIYRGIKSLILGGIIIFSLYKEDITLFDAWQKIKMFFIKTFMKNAY